MAEDPNQIERHIESTRRELGSNLHELQSRVKQATDWHTYVDRSPAMMIGIAFGAGVLAGVMSHRSRTPDAGYRYRMAGTELNRPARATEHEMNKATDTLDTIKGAMIGLAATQLKKLLSETVPGFHEHYEKTERQKSGPTSPAMQSTLAH